MKIVKVNVDDSLLVKDKDGCLDKKLFYKRLSILKDMLKVLEVELWLVGDWCKYISSDNGYIRTNIELLKDIEDGNIQDNVIYEISMMKALLNGMVYKVGGTDVDGIVIDMSEIECERCKTNICSCILDIVRLG